MYLKSLGVFAALLGITSLSPSISSATDINSSNSVVIPVKGNGDQAEVEISDPAIKYVIFHTLRCLPFSWSERSHIL